MEEAQDQSTGIELDELSPEERHILVWRYRQLRELGIGRLLARLLAESGADLGLVRRLVAQGCAPELAAKIAL
ncbi:MAG TPA: hypothetical protein VGF23_05720 [Gaiellaceae bacterium]